jgi:hypothetical protein
MALTETELLSILQSEITGAIGYHSSELSDQRKTAQEYYYGEPFGNEAEGRSNFVTRDVAETIEWRMPSLMRIFTGGDTIVRFEPQGPEDEQKAQQATDYINYIFQKQNDGFLTLYTWFKDALLFKNGFVKVYWEEYTDYKTETYEKLTDDEFAMLLQDDVEPLEHTEDVSMDAAGMPQRVHSLKIRKKSNNGKCCIIPVPPEEILVSKNPIAPLYKNRFIAHRRRVTIGEMIEMGLIESADEIPADNDDNFNEETIARFAIDETDSSLDSDPKDPLSREVWVSECYRKIDFDGDGISEERTITICGNKVLKNEEGYTAKIISLTPIILPHKLFGMSDADLAMPHQLLKSTVFRQILDNMYLANNGRYMALDGMVNIDDLLTSRPGGIVRVKTFDAVKPMQPPLLGAPAFNLLEYIDTLKENSTGITRYNQGVDADSLNKTATGINQIMSASQSRTELIARVFAETGVKDLFYAILECVQKYQDHSQVIKLRNDWVPMDPREWTSKFDLSVTVGLGTGSKESQLMALNEETQYQAAAIQAGLPIVTPENIYNLRMKALEAKNIKGGDLFYTHPSKMPPPQPQQNPDAIKLELEKMKGENKAQLQQMKTQNDMVKQEQKQEHEQQKMKIQAMIDAALQANEQRAQAQQQAQQQAGVAQENDKAREQESNVKLVDILWEKNKGEEEAKRGQQQEEMKAILSMIQDNSKAQNEAILKMIEASLAERETEVAERDAKGKVKKTVSRVKK